MNKCYKIMLLWLFHAGFAFSEEAITAFNEKFAVNLFGKYNMGILAQQQTASYRTDKPWDIGLGVRYKNMTARIFVPLSFNDTAFDLELNSYFTKLYFELLVKRYQKFYLNKETKYGDAGLDIMSSGITACRIHNNQNHSLGSVYSLDRKQNISSGSFLYGFGVFYTSIFSENNDMGQHNERSHLIHFGPIAGYSYIWILPFGIFINVGITMGTNLGITITENKLLFIPQINPRISFGHHNRTWSINAVMGCNAAMITWDTDNFNILVPSTMAVTFSKRF